MLSITFLKGALLMGFSEKNIFGFFYWPQTTVTLVKPLTMRSFKVLLILLNSSNIFLVIPIYFKLLFHFCKIHKNKIPVLLHRCLKVIWWDLIPILAVTKFLCAAFTVLLLSAI